MIWVSNHGGRQLDTALGSLDMLREVMEVVGDRADVIMDGGIQRGTDVLKAIAMGANAVSIGRLQGWGLAAAGKEGVVRVLEILENEIISAMGLLGVTSMDQLGPEYLTPAERVTPPHEMSAWVNMPGLPFALGPTHTGEAPGYPGRLSCSRRCPRVQPGKLCYSRSTRTPPRGVPPCILITSMISAQPGSRVSCFCSTS